MKALQDFVSKEPRKYSFQMGKEVASALSGFIAGAIVASIIWLAAWYLVLVQ